MKALLLMALLMPITCMALDNSQYWQMEQNMRQRQIINEMDNMRRAQERANQEAQTRFLIQQQQLQQQNIWNNWPYQQPQFYPIKPIGR